MDINKLHCRKVLSIALLISGIVIFIFQTGMLGYAYSTETHSQLDAQITPTLLLDTFVASQRAISAFTEVLWLGNDTTPSSQYGLQRILLRFEGNAGLKDVNVRVESAILYFYQVNRQDPSEDMSVGIALTSSNWPSDVIWANQPSPTSNFVPGVIGGATEQQYPMDVTELIRQWTNTSEDSINFIIVGDESSGDHERSFESKDCQNSCSNQPPSLVIDYSLVSPPTLTPTETPTDTPIPTATSTPTITPTPTKGIAYLRLRSEPTSAIEEGDTLTYTIEYGAIDYPNSEYELTDVVITNVIPEHLELIPGNLPDPGELYEFDYSGIKSGSVLTWTRSELKDNQTGSISYQVQWPSPTPTLIPTVPPTPGNLQLTKKGTPIATPGAPIVYTLVVTNTSNFTVTNVVISDHIPEGAQYIAGGNRNGEVVEWNDISELGPGDAVKRVFVVRASQTITNSDYSVKADEFGPITGGPPFVTLIGDDVLIEPIDDGVIINEGATIEWQVDGKKGKLESGPTFNPLYQLHFPYIRRDSSSQ